MADAPLRAGMGATNTDLRFGKSEIYFNLGLDTNSDKRKVICPTRDLFEPLQEITLAQSGGWAKPTGRANARPMAGSACPPDARESALRADLQEFYAERVAATPNHLAWLTLLMRSNKRQSEPGPDVNRGIRHDFGAAWRDVQHETFATGHAIVDRHRGRAALHLPPRFALNLRPFVNRHL